MFCFFSQKMLEKVVKNCNIMYKCKDIELNLSFVESVLNKNLP